MSSNSLQTQSSIWLFTLGLGFIFLFYITSYLIEFIGIDQQPVDAHSLPSVLVIFSILSVLVSNKISSILSKPFLEIRQIVEKFNQGSYSNIASEFQTNIEEFKELEMFLLNSLKLKSETFNRESEFAKKVRQVAHDIRSPLLALEVISRNTPLNDKRSKLLVESISHVKEISNTFLSKYKEHGENEEETSVSEIVEIFPLILEVVNSQRITTDKNKVSISINSSETEKSVRANINPILFKRVISNLINNAKESIKHTGNINIDLKLLENSIRVIIKDDGCGMSADIMSNIFEEGFTYGKKQGTGLGLYFVVRCIESWGGDLDVSSKVGEGTTFRFILPESRSFKRSIILLDDSMSVTMSWELEAEKKGVDIKTFNEIDGFMSHVKKCRKEVEIYVDSDLNSYISGEALLKELDGLGFKNIFLETGSDANDYKHVTWVKSVVGKKPPFSSESG